MINHEPKEIGDARKLFAKYEKSSSHEERIKYFTQAIETLNTYMEEEELDERSKQVIENLKGSHIREMIRSLPLPQDTDDWVFYVRLVIKIKKDIHKACAEDHNLDEKRVQWIDKVLKYVGRL